MVSCLSLAPHTGFFFGLSISVQINYIFLCNVIVTKPSVCLVEEILVDLDVLEGLRITDNDDDAEYSLFGDQVAVSCPFGYSPNTSNVDGPLFENIVCG